MRLFIFLLLIFVVLDNALGLEICQRSAKWRLSSLTFPNNFPGEVKVVALLKANCRFCRTQAKRLEGLRTELQKENYQGISFLIVNSFEYESIRLANFYKTVTSIPVVQDIQKIDVFEILDGELDDILIFDKCNRLVSHLKIPESVLTEGHVKKEIINAYKNEKCGKSCKSSKKKPIKTFIH